MRFVRRASALGAASSMILTLLLTSSSYAQGMARGGGGMARGTGGSGNNGNFMARGTGGGGNFTARGTGNGGGFRSFGDTAAPSQPRATSQPRSYGNNNPGWGAFTPSFTPQPSG